MNRILSKVSLMLNKLPSWFPLSELNFSWYILICGSRIHYKCLNQVWITYYLWLFHIIILIFKISQEVKKHWRWKYFYQKKKKSPRNLISWKNRALLEVVNIIKIITQSQEKKISQHAFEEGYLNSPKDQLLFVRITTKVNREHWQALFS